MISLLWTFLLIPSARDLFTYTNDTVKSKTSLIESIKMGNIENDDEVGKILSMIPESLRLLRQSLDPLENNTCRHEIHLILNGIEKLNAWALKFYDATGKFPEGLLAGSLYQMGNFDECLDIGFNHDTPENIRGQYCLSEVNLNVSKLYLKLNGSVWNFFQESHARYEKTVNKLYWGICLPASCTPKGIEDTMNSMFSIILTDPHVNVTSTISEKSCYKNESISINAIDTAYVCLILSIIFVILISTIFHALRLNNKNKKANGLLAEIMIAFSLISNIKKLLSPVQNDGLNLDCISGIRFISMVLIVAAHSVMFITSGPILNKRFWEEAITKLQNCIFLNNPLLVDTFLFLSGFLFCRLLLQELDRRKSVNFIALYVFRYVRLTPAYFAMISLYVTWLSKLDSGPLWSRMELEKERCLSSWWTNLLYINNYVKTDNLCMFQSWYLSVDTQLFVLAPLIIYPLWKWRKWGVYLLAAVTTFSTLIPFVVTLINNLEPTLLFYPPDIKDVTTNEYFKNNYIKTHMRAETYCFGLVYGYLVYRIQMTGKCLSKNLVRFGWLISTVLLIISMSSINIFYGPRKYFTAIEAAVYSSLHRALWSMGTGWVIVACVTNNAGPIRKLLTWRFFVPFSRLTYCAYLVNGLVVLHSSSTVRSPQYLSNFNLFFSLLVHLALTFIGAFVLSITFESPVVSLKRIFLRDNRGVRENHEGDGNVSST